MMTALNIRTRKGIAIAVLGAASMLFAQETRRTVENPAQNPADDTKDNSSAVPDAYAVTGQFDRIVVVRLKYKTDLLAGLEQIAKQQHIENGVILAGMGSVLGYQIHQVISRGMPPRNTYENNPTLTCDLVSMNGYVVNGRVHAHVTLATPDRTIGGHLELGTEVFTFIVVTIGVMNDADLSRVDDATYR